MSNEKILVVEDDRLLQKMLGNKLQEEGYQVFGATNASDGLVALEEKQPDLMILDLNLSSDPTFAGISDGFGLLYWFRSSSAASHDLPVIIYTADASREVDKKAQAARVCAVIRKCDPVDHLLTAIRNALDARQNPSGWEGDPSQ